MNWLTNLLVHIVQDRLTSDRGKMTFMGLAMFLSFFPSQFLLAPEVTRVLHMIPIRWTFRRAFSSVFALQPVQSYWHCFSFHNVVTWADPFAADKELFRGAGLITPALLLRRAAVGKPHAFILFLSFFPLLFIVRLAVPPSKIEVPYAVVCPRPRTLSIQFRCPSPGRDLFAHHVVVDLLGCHRSQMASKAPTGVPSIKPILPLVAPKVAIVPPSLPAGLTRDSTGRLIWVGLSQDQQAWVKKGQIEFAWVMLFDVVHWSLESLVWHKECTDWCIKFIPSPRTHRWKKAYR